MAYHFADVSKMVSVGSGAEREIDDIYFTRYACYLIAQNGDPKKEEIAFAQSYSFFIFMQRHLKTFLSKRRKSYPLHFDGNRGLITLPVFLFPSTFLALKLVLLFFLSVDPFLFSCFLDFPNTPSKTPLFPYPSIGD